MSKVSTSTYKTDKRYPGVRRRYIGFVYGFGEDWIFSLNCRDKNAGNKIRNDILGKASEGWTMQKAFLEKERLLAINLEDEIVNNDYSSVTLKDVFQDYSVYYAQERRKCIVDYTNYSKKIPFFNTKPIAMIKNRDMQDLRKKLEKEKSVKGKPYSAKTINEILSLVPLLINHGVKRELCNARPDLVIEKLTVNNQVTEFLDDKQLTAYKQALETDKDIIGVAFLKVALYTGMRPKAIRNLKWEDIDFQSNIIKLRAEVAKNNTDSYIPLSRVCFQIILTKASSMQ